MLLHHTLYDNNNNENNVNNYDNKSFNDGNMSVDSDDYVIVSGVKSDNNNNCNDEVGNSKSKSSDISNRVTRRKSPNVYKSCPKMISVEKC